MLILLLVYVHEVSFSYKKKRRAQTSEYIKEKENIFKDSYLN